MIKSSKHTSFPSDQLASISLSSKFSKQALSVIVPILLRKIQDVASRGGISRSNDIMSSQPSMYCSDDNTSSKDFYPSVSLSDTTQTLSGSQVSDSFVQSYKIVPASVLPPCGENHICNSKTTKNTQSNKPPVHHASSIQRSSSYFHFSRRMNFSNVATSISLMMVVLFLCISNVESRTVCMNIPCANGGRKLVSNSIWGRCRCICQSGYVGPYCQYLAARKRTGETNEVRTTTDPHHESRLAAMTEIRNRLLAVRQRLVRERDALINSNRSRRNVNIDVSLVGIDAGRMTQKARLVNSIRRVMRHWPVESDQLKIRNFQDSSDSILSILLS